ncbi:MAG: hypothetical protein LUQ11_13870, partial [Methylococcaceae bacterium]|nr:hypothetical protein [Methylococcaceae bacterium]
PWVAIQSFFGHPCLRLHLPFSQGNGWTSTSLLTTMPVAPHDATAYAPYAPIHFYIEPFSSDVAARPLCGLQSRIA